jgi:septal ring factor EnvC (AmiA/AmiB activator)
MGRLTLRAQVEYLQVQLRTLQQQVARKDEALVKAQEAYDDLQERLANTANQLNATLNQQNAGLSPDAKYLAKLLEAHHNEVPRGSACSICASAQAQETAKKKQQAGAVEFDFKSSPDAYPSPDHFPKGMSGKRMTKDK